MQTADWSEVVGPGVFAIDTGYVRPRLDASHLIIDQGTAALIDTGVASSVPRILAAIAEQGLSVGDVRWVILTHIHLDHAGAAGALMVALPNATLIVHPRGARHMADPAKLIAGSRAVYGDEAFDALYGEILPVPAERIQTTTDGESLTLGGRRLTFLHTPGHAKHHHCIVDDAADAVFTGDTFGLSYRELDVDGRPFIFPTTTPVHFDPDAAHTSIERIRACRPSAVFLTHYSRVEGVDALAETLHADLDAFVALTRASLSRPNPEAWLTAAITEHLLARLSRHGYRGDAAESVLEMDIALNASGLLIWGRRA
ncbi:MAG: glyoxylase-like metal-dependent hydrolase (beta-lactamase superfamily II) [Myxococcota bacterium]